MTLNIGDVVFYKTHPYTKNIQDIKISTYIDYTAPILVVEKKIGEKKHDSATGKEVGEMIDCIYYNTNEGKFTSKRIHSKELIECSEPIDKEREPLLKKIDVMSSLEQASKEGTVKNIDAVIKEKFLHKKVVLKSVDLELHKRKISREKDNGEMVETNHLEFLPPVMTVIDFRYSDDKHKFCTKTGKPIIEFKCKWYNSKLKSFSEEFFNLELVYEVDESKSKLLNDYSSLIDKNSFNLVELKEPFVFTLEGAISVVHNSLVQVESIIYKHYYYEALVYSLLKDKKESLLIKNEIKEINDNVLWGPKYPDYVSRQYINGLMSFSFAENEYYLISYTDMAARFTKRVIKIRDIFFVINNKKELYDRLGWATGKGLSASDSKIKSYLDKENMFFIKELGVAKVKVNKNKGGVGVGVNIPIELLKDKSITVLLEANCLRKNGAIRHFRLDGISEVRAINKGVDLFEHGIVPVND